MSTFESVSIQPIDKTTVNQICSGQVVLNLATAVKELIENSIDAGADSIQVKLEEYGSESIEVIDNGCGVEEVNFQALTLKHHTSKIKEFSDLYSVETFGFRGEALSSLCSLCDVTIITKHKNADIGATLKYDRNGIITSHAKTLRKTGTTLRLENLFSPLPIRRTEFLKNLKREYSKMCNVLYAYGLLSERVRITCTNNVYKSKLATKDTQDKKITRSTTSTIMDTKGDSLESNIISIFGLKQKQNLLKITEKTPTEETLAEFNLHNKNLDLQKFKLTGYISSCAHGSGRATSDRQFYYINSRPVDNQKISKLVNEIYHQYNSRQDPFVVLNIAAASGSFDMNLTPDKRQILLQNEKLLLAVLKESLSALFQNIPATMEIQNIGFNCGSQATDTVALRETFERFKADFKSLQDKNEKREQVQSRLDSLLKFRLTTKRVSPIDVISKNCSKSEIKCEFENSQEILNVNSDKNQPGSPEDKSEPASGDENFDLSAPRIIVNTENNDVSINEEVICQELDEEGITVLSPKHEIKRKLVGRFVCEDSFAHDSEEINSKRIKVDEGLAEEDKSKRKTVTCNITLSTIKKLGLKSVEKKSEEKSEVKFLSEIKPQSNERAENELKKELKKESFAQMEIIGQFNLGFIITKLGSDVFIIDQHASDEKYNYEMLQATTVMQTQRLLNPEKLQLTPDKEELMAQHQEIFKKNGFDFVFDKEAPSTRRISLTSIPMSKNYVFGKDDVDELLFLLEDASDVSKIRPSRVDSMFASRACRKSVMIGTPMNQQEMRKVVNHMGEMEHPWNCPHGRPTMRHLVNLQMIHVEE